MPESVTTLQSTILRLLSQRSAEDRLGNGRCYFSERVRSSYSKDAQPTLDAINEMLWSLLGKGLIYIDISQPAPANWRWCLTQGGKTAALDEQFNPDDPEQYMKRLQINVPEASESVFLYAREALLCYNAEVYLASTVMLGVASEAAFLDVASSSVPWLKDQGAKLRNMLANPRTPFNQKLEEFRKRLDPRKGELPSECIDRLDLVLNSVLELLRMNRNDAGHPTGKTVQRDDQYISLQMFARYLKKLYDLRRFFLGDRS